MFTDGSGEGGGLSCECVCSSPATAWETGPALLDNLDTSEWYMGGYAGL